jgi:hypothetical protein
MCMGGSDSGQITETSDMVVQQQINTKLWDSYQNNYKPLIDQYSKMTTDPERMTEQERQVAGKLDAEVMKNVDPSRASTNPVANTKTMANLSKAGSGAQVQGQGGVKSRQLGDIQNIIDIGRGQATTAQAGLGDIATQSLKAEIASKDIQQQEQGAMENAYGSIAGAVAAGALTGKKNVLTSRQLTYDPNQNLNMGGSF